MPVHKTLHDAEVGQFWPICLDELCHTVNCQKIVTQVQDHELWPTAASKVTAGEEHLAMRALEAEGLPEIQLGQ